MCRENVRKVAELRQPGDSLGLVHPETAASSEPGAGFKGFRIYRVVEGSLYLEGQGDLVSR